ncbi:molybdopterin-dependent oxidoreductase [Desulfovibrio sp. OttesenSCG-928-C14]|nr:molybdopterin-dependent oxidoreductase [Desulfovibrio sp. OttesenSCG-928-C14]
MKRRSFLKFAAGAGVGVLATPIPWQLTDDISIWTQNWPWVPKNPKGENSYAKTTSKLCPTACGLTVRSVAGQPVRALACPDHPLGGGVSALAAAELQLLYSPARLQLPLLRKGDGALVQVTWDEALAVLGRKLKEAGSSVACVSGDENGSSSEYLSAFLAALGSERIYLMPSEGQCASVAWEAMGGQGQPGYNLEDADFVLAVGANVLDSWGTAVRNRRIFGAKHPTGGKAEQRFIYAGPVQNNSAAAADGWIPLRPGAEAVFLLGLAAQALKAGRRSYAEGFSDLQRILAPLTPDAVEKISGVPAAAQAELAKALLEAKAPLVLAGSPFNSGSGALPLAASYALNMLIGSAGRTLTALPLYSAGLKGAQSRQQIYRRDLAWLMDAGLASKAKAVIFYDANPAYALPNAGAVAEAIKNIPFKVSFSAFYDETAQLCDLVLPCSAGIERLDDVESPYGCGKPFYALCRPLAKPAFTSRHGLDVLADLAASALGKKLPRYAEVLAAKAGAVGVNWKPGEENPVFEGSRLLSVGSLRFNAQVLGKAARLAPGPDLALAPVYRNALGTAQTGIPPFNLKTVRDSELAGKDMYVMLNRATAAKLKVRQDDFVRLASAAGELGARVRIFEGVMDGCVGVNLGFGHTALDQFSRDKGGNAFALMSMTREDETGLSSWLRTEVTVSRA